eukprot:scaffold6333_cov61-Attheya_sp.AAC.3
MILWHLITISLVFELVCLRNTATSLVTNTRPSRYSSHEETCCHRTDFHDSDRRQLLEKALATTVGVFTSSAALPALASPSQSRTEGYSVQHSEKEWESLLSAQQYTILRRGGTERQRSSILDGEERVGTFVCAGCSTPLFASAAKFKSGTGWPSFASALLDDGAVVEVLDGAEVRCNTCGGHLGDVFNDGWRFVATPAFKTGKRFCIDGAALVFKPESGGKDVVGDRLPPNKVINYEPAAYRE